MNVEERRPYLIPGRITQRLEILPGWGWFELKAIGAALLGGLLLSGLAGLLGLPLLLRFFLILALPGGMAAVARPATVKGESPLTLLLAFRDYARRQRRYLYDFGRDDA